MSVNKLASEQQSIAVLSIGVLNFDIGIDALWQEARYKCCHG